jgi:fibronectin-binding autotransporter adhesin
MKPRILSTARLSFTLASAIAALLATQSIFAGTIWDGGGGATTNINTAANWDGTAPGVVNALNGTTAATFGTGGSTATINVAASFTGITINRDAAFTIADGAGALTLGTGGITVTLPTTTARAHTISESSLILNGNQSWTVTNNTGAASLNVSSLISETGGARTLTKAGTGTLILSGASGNTYTGLTTISGGVLRITKSAALGTVAGGVSLASGSGLEIDGTGGALTVGAEAISIAGGGVTLPTPNLGAIRNIAGNNTYGGTVTMTAQSRINSDAGTLTLNNPTAAVTGAFTLVVGGAGNVTISSPMTNGVGGVSKGDAGTLTLSGLNTFTGNVTVGGGILAAGVAGNGTNSALGSVSSTRTIAVNTGGTLRFDVGNVFNNNFASAASSVPALNIAGGTVTNASSATNSALGNITLAGGTLTATVGSASGYGSWNLNGTVTSTGTSTLSSSASVPMTLSAAVGTTTTFDVQSGTLTSSAALGEVTAAGDERVSGLTKIGSGMLVLSNTNNYTGNTAINAGVLNIATTGALPGYNVDGRYSVASGATLAVQNAVSDGDISAMLGTTNFLSGANFGFDTASGNRTYGANLTNTAQGPLGIVKLGANTLTLSGTNTYTGGTNVTAGTLNISSTSALPNWNVDGGFSLASGASLVVPNAVSESAVNTILGSTNVASGASLVFDTSAGDRTHNSAITNTTQGLLNIGKIGANTLTLAGANTYTGNTTLTSGTLNITGSLTGLAASSNLAYGNAAGNTIVNVSGSIADYKNFTGANIAGSIAVMNQTAGSTSTLGTNSQDTQWVAQNGGYGYLNITGGTFNTGRFDAVGAIGGGTAVVYVGGTGTFNNNSGDWLILPRKEGVGQLTVGPGGSLVRTAAVTSNLGITMDASNAHGALNIAGGSVDTGVRPLNFGFGSAAFTNTRGFVNLAGGTLSVGSAIVQSNANAGGQYFEYFNFGGGTLKSNAAMTWLPAASAVGHTITATIYGPVTNNNNANTAFNSQIGTSSNFSGGLTIDTNNFATNIAYPLSGAGGVGVTQANIGDVSLLSGNSGYIGAPAVVFSPPAAPGGVPASGYAVIDVGSGKVNGIVITNPGTYAATETPTVTLSGGGGSIAPFTTSALTTANTSGGLTKTGAGTLTLSGASTYTGATSVNVGTLNLTGSLTSSVTVANNANLGGEGSTTGALTFSGTSDLAFDPSTGGTFLTTGSVNATGASVTIAPTVPVTGTGIVVLDAAGGITGTAGGAGNNFIYTGRGSLYFNGGNTQLLIDTAPVSLAWFGNDPTNPTLWDLDTTTNWLSGGGQKFFTGDGVTFNDFAASFVVDINAAHVFPGNIVFSNNSPNTYTIQGAFGIFGGGTLTKNGTGTTVLNTSNGYTGATTVNDGVLNIRNASALGATTAGTIVASGALEIQGGITTAAEALTLNGSGVLSGGALRNISGNNTWGSSVALASASSIGSDAGTLTIPSLTGAFGLTKVGAGTVNITGATAVTSTVVEAGTLYMGAQTGASTTTTLGAASAVTLNGSGNLTVRRTNTGNSDVTGAIGGTGSLTLIGDNLTTSQSGDFVLNNTSTYSGGTTITGARVQYKAASALGTGSITTGPNGQVFFDAGMTLTNNFTLSSGLGWNESAGYLGALRMNGTTLSGTITLTAETRITSAGTSTLSGVISGGFGMDFFEDNAIGTISLSGENTYTGTTTVNSMGAGSTFPNLIVGNNSALGTTAGGTVVVGGGTTGVGSQLTLADGITVTDETLTLDATSAGYRASLVTGGTATWDGNVITAGTGGFVGFYTNGAGMTIGSTDADTITGTNSLVLRGTGTGTVNSTLSMGANGIIKTDASTWTITSNNNDFTGIPAAASGILSVSSIANIGVNSALGAGASITLGQNSATAGRLQFTGVSGGASNRALFINNGTTGGAGAIENTVTGQTLTLSGALTVATPASACSLTLTGAGDGVLSGGIAATPALSLIKSGAGTWTLPVANTYTGATIIGGGTLALTTISPSLAGGLTFGTALGNANVGTLDLSGIAASATFGGALTVQTNSVTANTITLGSAKTLTINGGLAMSNNVDDGETRLTMTGGGALVVNGASITVGNNTVGTNNSSEAHLNLAALDSFTSTLSGNLTIQASGDNSGSDASSLTLSDVANSITAAAVRVGNSSTGSAQRLWLGGGTNVIQTDLINLGAGTRDTGIIDFAGTGGSFNLRNVAGTGRVAAVNLGPQSTQTTGYSTANLIDLTGNTADVAIGTFATSLGAKTAANTNDLSFDTGTLDILSINMAFAKGTGSSTNRITIGGGTVRLGGSAAFSDAGTGTLTLATAGSGELIINGGTVTTTASLLKGTGAGTATVTINGGTLDMGGTNIGAATNTVVLAAQSGTLQNVGQINNGAGLTKSTAGTLILAGTNTYTGDTTVSDGILELADNAQIKFVLGATTGSNNRLTGAGTVTLGGDFNIDTSAADGLSSGSWTLVDHSTLAETYNSNFSVVGFTDAGGNKWTKPNGASSSYTFDEATGVLTLGPSASYASWIAGFGLTGPDALATADPDFDGIDNAAEMVFGGNPATGMDAALLPTIEMVSADPDGNLVFADYLLFTYRRTDLSVTAGVTAACETDTDLIAPWSTAVGGVSGVVILTDNNYNASFTPPTAVDTDRVRVYVPRGVNPTLFGRLNVTVP